MQFLNETKEKENYSCPRVRVDLKFPIMEIVFFVVGFVSEFVHGSDLPFVVAFTVSRKPELMSAIFITIHIFFPSILLNI